MNFAVKYQWFVTLYVSREYNMVYNTFYVAGIVNAHTHIAEKNYILVMFIHQGKNTTLFLKEYLFGLMIRVTTL